MKKNMGATDKVIRILIAIVIAYLFYTNVITGVLAVILLVFAGIFVLTSFVSFCPIYTVFGIQTCPKKE
jgi:hypothetical protein